MPDLADVLAGLSGEGATLVKGTISAVSTGRLTVTINGGTFDRVPYLDLGTAWTPAVGAQVYLLNQKGFGMLAIGSPKIPAADPAVAASITTIVNPDTVGNWTARTQTWTVPLDGVLNQVAPETASGAWFYDPADFAAWIGRTLARVEIELSVLSGTPALALLRNAPLDGPPDPVAAPQAVSAPLGGPVWVPLPLSWGNLLVSGEARGILASSLTFDAVLDLHGSVRLTSL
jgi:hypothetical protein